MTAESTGAFFPTTKHGDGVWLFALDGRGQPDVSTEGFDDADAADLTH